MNVIYLLAFLCPSVLGRIALSVKDIDVTKNEVDIDDIKVKVSYDNDPKYHEDHENQSDVKNDTIIDAKTSKEKDEESKPALFLTPYIEAGRLEEARLASRVNSTLFLNVTSYSGYVTVNKEYNSNIFFWYFPVEGTPANDTPWLIWLQGGPGVSSMVGLFQELGPLKFNKNNELERNPNSWTQNQSIVFIDNPVGCGFSFTDHNDGLARNINMYSKDLYSAVKQLVRVYPELQTAPLYVAGESYGGKYVPGLAMEIHEHGGEHINMKGVIIGNGFIDPVLIKNPTKALYNVGMLSAEQVSDLSPFVTAMGMFISRNQSEEAQQVWSGIVMMMTQWTDQSHLYNFIGDDPDMGDYMSSRMKYVRFIELDDVRQALHTGDQPFHLLNMTVHSSMSHDFLISTSGRLQTLLEHYRVLCYCGQLDLMIPCVAAAELHRRWKWSGAEEFRKASRHPFQHEGRVAGYYKSGGGFTEVVVRGAGHMVPQDRAAAAAALVARWVRALPPPVSSTSSFNLVIDNSKEFN